MIDRLAQYGHVCAACKCFGRHVAWCVLSFLFCSLFPIVRRIALLITQTRCYSTASQRPHRYGPLQIRLRISTAVKSNMGMTSALSRGGIRKLRSTWFWALTSPRSKRHLDWFVRFCRVHFFITAYTALQAVVQCNGNGQNSTPTARKSHDRFWRYMRVLWRLSAQGCAFGGSVDIAPHVEDHILKFHFRNLNRHFPAKLQYSKTFILSKLLHRYHIGHSKKPLSVFAGAPNTRPINPT